MPPAAIALISEPSITFQPTEASTSAIASSTSIVSPTACVLAPEFGRQGEAEHPGIDECVDRFRRQPS